MVMLRLLAALYKNYLSEIEIGETMQLNRALMLVIGAALAAQALVARAHDDDDAKFTLASPGSVLVGYVTGAAVPITVTSTARISRGSLKLTLNGADVTSVLHADGA